MLKVKYAVVILITKNGNRPGKRGNYLFIEQNVERDPVSKTVAGMIYVGVRLRHTGSTGPVVAGSLTAPNRRDTAPCSTHPLGPSGFDRGLRR